jgi:hypothetical protein
MSIVAGALVAQEILALPSRSSRTQDRTVSSFMSLTRPRESSCQPIFWKGAATFHEKVKAGTEKYYGGFDGKGPDRPNKARARQDT